MKRILSAYIISILMTCLGCSSSGKNEAPALKEASANFDLKDVAPFLERVIRLVDSGFSAQEVKTIGAVAKSLKVDEEKEFIFPIIFQGSPSTLKVQIAMDDIEAPDLYFFAVPRLADQITEEIQKFANEGGQ